MKQQMDIESLNTFLSTSRECLDILLFSALGYPKAKEFVFEDDRYYSKDILLLAVGATFLGNLLCLISDGFFNKDKCQDKKCNNIIFGICCVAAVTSIALLELKETIGLKNDNIPAALFLFALSSACVLSIFNVKYEVKNFQEKYQYLLLSEIPEEHKKSTPDISLVKAIVNMTKLSCAVGAIYESFLAKNPNEVIRESLCYATGGCSFVGLSLALYSRRNNRKKENLDTESPTQIQQRIMA